MNDKYFDKKMLVLGSDYGTIEVVKTAKDMGIYVVVADLMETSPTKEAADESWLISTTDTDLLIEKCKENGINCIMFGASDFNISNAKKICKVLGLPIYCESDYACRVARDKAEFKRICKKVGAPVATDYYLSDKLSKEELCSIKYPVVIKPCDKSGNRGMSYCENAQELINGYKAAREISDGEIVVERRLHGEEYNVHYVLADGEAQLLYFNSTHHQTGMSENLYSFKCTTRNHLKQYIDEVNDSVIDAIKAANCKEGIAWVDCIRDEDGHFYILELGHRFGGVMTYRPYQKACGFDTIKWMIECSLGIKHKKEDLPNIEHKNISACAASYHLFTLKQDTISEIKGIEELEEMSNVFIDMPKRKGNEVRKLACMGLIGICGSNADEICNTLETVNKVLSIKDSDGKELIIHYDDYETVKNEYINGEKEFYE